MTLPPPHTHTELVIGFQPVVYNVVEGVDNNANLVAMVISGNLGRDVSISFNTRDGSAIGMCMCVPGVCGDVKRHFL